MNGTLETRSPVVGSLHHLYKKTDELGFSKCIPSVDLYIKKIESLYESQALFLSFFESQTEDSSSFFCIFGLVYLRLDSAFPNLLFSLISRVDRRDRPSIENECKRGPPRQPGKLGRLRYRMHRKRMYSDEMLLILEGL